MFNHNYTVEVRVKLLPILIKNIPLELNSAIKLRKAIDAYKNKKKSSIEIFDHRLINCKNDLTDVVLFLKDFPANGIVGVLNIFHNASIADDDYAKEILKKDVAVRFFCQPDLTEDF